VHHRETSNALNASVRCKQKRIQRLSETLPANNRILQAVRQGIPHQQTSHTESRSVIGAESVARYDQVADRRCCHDATLATGWHNSTTYGGA